MTDEIQATKNFDTALEAIRHRDPQAFSPANMQRLRTEHLEPQHDPRSTSGWSLKRDPAVTVGVRLPQWLVQAIDAYVIQLGADVSRSDVCRQWIRDGLYTALSLQEGLIPENDVRKPLDTPLPGSGELRPQVVSPLPSDPVPVPAPASGALPPRVPDAKPKARTSARNHEAQIGPQIRDIARGYPGIGLRKHPEYIKYEDFAGLLAEKYGITNTKGQPLGKGALGRMLKHSSQDPGA